LEKSSRMMSTWLPFDSFEAISWIVTVW